MANKVMMFMSWPGLKRFLTLNSIDADSQITTQEQITNAADRVITVDYNGQTQDLKVQPSDGNPVSQFTGE
tara:strand:- start:6866 stop:7078 length:213 start_codon:yes stop_codon:yes gene_type:complete